MLYDIGLYSRGAASSTHHVSPWLLNCSIKARIFEQWLFKKLNLIIFSIFQFCSVYAFNACNPFTINWIDLYYFCNFYIFFRYAVKYSIFFFFFALLWFMLESSGFFLNSLVSFMACLIVFCIKNYYMNI